MDCNSGACNQRGEAAAKLPGEEKHQRRSDSSKNDGTQTGGRYACVRHSENQGHDEGRAGHSICGQMRDTVGGLLRDEAISISVRHRDRRAVVFKFVGLQFCVDTQK